MNFFDREILLFLNQFAQRSPAFDQFVQMVAGNSLVKAVPLMMLIWWTWFQQNETENRNRERIITTLVLSIVTILIARTLSDLLPLRVRPIINPALGFRVPHGAYLHDYAHWNSFPSDHAILFYFVSTGLFFVSHSVGIIAFIHTTVVICLPRLYMGYHYPTDIIAGAFIGIGAACLGNIQRVSSLTSRAPLRVLRQNPALFYALMFLLTYLLADLFDEVRRIIFGIYEYLTGRR